ncbi:unnamed protein product [Caretta caretta]
MGRKVSSLKDVELSFLIFCFIQNKCAQIEIILRMKCTASIQIVSDLTYAVLIYLHHCGNQTTLWQVPS